MPAKSGKQYRLMAMVAHDPAMAKKMGIPQSVGEEMVKKTKPMMRSKFMKHDTIMGGKR